MIIWTGNIVTAQNTYLLVSVLTAGSTLMGLMFLPFSLQLAFGWTRLGLYMNIIAVITLIPLLIWLVSNYGVLGASFIWVALYIGQIIGMIHLMHRRILKGEKLKWYLDDVGKPLLAALIIVGIARIFINVAMTKLILIASLGVICLLAVCASAMSASLVRKGIFVKFRSLRHIQQFNP